MLRESHVLAPGTLIASDFRVVRLLAEGGMGAVYVVDQLSTGNQRALKVVREELLKDEKTVERFKQEARVSARIPSDHVVQVLGAGVDPATRMPFMVMELLQGETLFTRVINRGPVDVASAIELFEQLSHALGAAHGIGVIHRDLKPENVFLARGRRARGGTLVKVLDFGVAKVLAEARTLATSAIGTPAWMAPEQTELRSTVTPATDIWALGLLAFFTLTGKYFWRACNTDGAGVNVLMRELLFEPIPRASERAAELGVAHLLPPGFDDLFARCVARVPAERYQDTASAESVLLSLLEQSPASQGVRRGGTLSDPDPGENQRSSTEPAFVDYAPPAKGSTVMAEGPLPGVAEQRLSVGGHEPLVYRSSDVPVQRVSIPGPARPLPPPPPVQAVTGGSPRGSVALVPPPPPRSAPRKKGLDPIIAIPIALLVASILAVIVYRASVVDDGDDKRPSKKDDDDGETIPLPNKRSADPRPQGGAAKPATATAITAAPPPSPPPPPPAKAEPRVACSQAPAKIYLADDFRDGTLGWALDDPWQIGPVTGGQLGKAGTGWPDPDKDHRGSPGARIAGVALGGNYKLVAGLKAMTSPKFDASGAGRLVLQYYRHLNCDEGGFVPHGVDVSSDDGKTWTQVWRQGFSPVAEKAWSLQTHDLSKYASSQMRVRFFYQVINMEAFTASGWNLDDVVVASSECF